MRGLTVNTARKGYIRKMLQYARSFRADITTQPDGTIKGTAEVGGEKFEATGGSNGNVMNDLHAQVAERFRAGGLPTLTQTTRESEKLQ
jgi:hypothetical protein